MTAIDHDQELWVMPVECMKLCSNATSQV
jgi:hypothetical protein